MKKKNQILFPIFICIAIGLLIVFLHLGSSIKAGKNENLLNAIRLFHFKNPFSFSLPEIGPEEEYDVVVLDEGYSIYLTEYGGAYRYGPSIIRYDDGSMDMWLVSEGNSSSEWDWIVYRHSEDGENWTDEKIVLKPTPGSADQCSVCDPGVIFFNGYYYLAYTSTSDRPGNGMNNSAFVARSKDPDGPFEKWNGSGWGGEPKAMIRYEGDPKGWGIGEVSFVIKDEELYIYYTYFDLNGGWTELAKSDLSENWPKNIEAVSTVYGRSKQDSLDVVYAEDLDLFLGFAIQYKMTEASKVFLCVSRDGTKFESADKTDKYVKQYAHNLGISKSIEGHIDTREEQLIGYAYGKNWGKWSARLQKIRILHKMK
ncbi:MAG: hypothetical protein IJI44_07490 [Erysipelotrichaceae bacterium]|nr:hypothetical protein [Erysipelotrichaceae bacterium]